MFLFGQSEDRSPDGGSTWLAISMRQSERQHDVSDTTEKKAPEGISGAQGFSRDAV